MNQTSAPDTLSSGELARRAGVNTQTLRYYEREGLIPLPARSEGGYRLYPSEEIQRVQFIKHAQSLGFSLSEIKELLSLKVSAEPVAYDVKRLAEKKIEAIELKIRDLEWMKDVLLHLAQACPGQGPTQDCPILQLLSEPIKRERR